MLPHPETHPSPGSRPGGSHLPAPAALRIAADLTDTEEDLHAITRVVLALVGADDDLTGDAAESALANAGVPAEARRLLMAALGPPAGRPTVAALRAGLEAAIPVAAAESNAESAPPARPGIAGLFDELRTRRVTRTAFWYVGGSVAVVEAANLFLPMLGAPAGAVRLLAVVAVCGLPIALALAWSFDVAQAAESPRSRWPRVALILGVTALSLAGATLIWKGGPPATTAESGAPALPPDPSHIAVLGFDAIGGDDDLAAFASQLQTRLIDGLSSAARGGTTSRQLRVLSYAGVMPFMRRDFAVDSLREARRVGLVLAGSVEQLGPAVRVSIRLVDTQSGDQIHTSSTRVDSGDRVALLEAIADSVLHIVRGELGPVVRDHMRLLETSSRPAFERLVWATRRLEDFDLAFDRSDYDAAEEVLRDVDAMLREAERLDPQWIEPILERGRRAKAFVRLALARHDSSAIVPLLATGIAHAERALALDPSQPRALELRGDLRHYQLQLARPASEAEADELRDSAENDLRASLVEHPAPAAALRMLSELAGSNGRLREALQYGGQAYDQDPFMEQVQWTVFRLFEYSFAAREDSAAAHWCTEGRQRFGGPVFDDCRLALGAWSDAYPLAPDSAWSLVAAELGAYPQPLRPRLEPRLHAMVAAVLARTGERDSARAVLRAARARDGSPGVLRAAAAVHGLLGEPDSAIDAVRTLLRDVPSDRRALENAPELRSIADDPRLRTLLQPRTSRDDRLLSPADPF